MYWGFFSAHVSGNLGKTVHFRVWSAGCGQIVLSVAVMAILITAPLGALGMDSTFEKLLEKE